MKAFKVMFVVFAMLLLAVPIVGAQEGWAGCPWGAAYDPMVQGYVPACFSRPADNAAALKPAGLAAPAPVVAPEQGSRCVSYEGPNYSVCVVASSDASAAAKPAGLAAPAPAVISEQGWPGCPWGDAYNPSVHGFVSECDIRPSDNSAALKPAGLAKPAPAVILEQGWSGCPWGAAYDPMVQGYVPACFSRPTDNAAALKSAGLAKLAPVEAFVPCGFGERLDPLALACLSQPAASAAAKPAGLAAPAPVVAPEQGSPCKVLESIYSAGYIACVDANRGTSAALKPAGLAKLAPVEAFVPCGFGERLDPLALACLSQSGASAAAKPAGLTAPTHERLVTCDTGEGPNRCPYP